MADLTITASAVRGSAGDSAPASATITAGKTVYKNTSGKWALADADVVAAASFGGITLHGADTDQPLYAAKSGTLTVQGGLTAGTFYYVSATAGGICPFADLTTGARVIQVGYAISTTVLQIAPVDTGVVL